jgi:hypothetical protein
MVPDVALSSRTPTKCHGKMGENIDFPKLEKSPLRLAFFSTKKI